MYWQKRFDREDPNANLEKLIKEIFEENKGNYGYRRIQLALKERGMKVNQKKNPPDHAQAWPKRHEIHP